MYIYIYIYTLSALRIPFGLLFLSLFQDLNDMVYIYIYIYIYIYNDK